MVWVKGQCSRCRVVLEREVPEAFARAELAAPLCPGCTDGQFLDGRTYSQDHT